MYGGARSSSRGARSGLGCAVRSRWPAQSSRVTTVAAGERSRRWRKRSRSSPPISCPGAGPRTHLAWARLHDEAEDRTEAGVQRARARTLYKELGAAERWVQACADVRGVAEETSTATSTARHQGGVMNSSGEKYDAIVVGARWRRLDPGDAAGPRRLARLALVDRDRFRVTRCRPHTMFPDTLDELERLASWIGCGPSTSSHRCATAGGSSARRSPAPHAVRRARPVPVTYDGSALDACSSISRKRRAPCPPAAAVVDLLGAGTADDPVPRSRPR
jgi:hypothetical protein